MKDQQNHRPRRSTTTWPALVAGSALSPARTDVPVVAIARAKTSLDLTFVIAVAA
jgi:hypothetical protein